MLKNLNLPAVLSLIVYPIILIALLVAYLLNYSVGWFEAGLFIAGYYISNITVGLGFHRLWSHDTYKTNSFVEFILVMLSAGALQGPALSWASNHFDHHTYTDTDKDPHNSLKYKSKFKSFWWSHMGWMLVGEGSYKSINRVTLVKLGRNKLLKWQLKYYWHIVIFMNAAVPALVGYAFGGTALTAYAGFLFIGIARAVQQQVTFFVNSTCHFAGTQKYVKGTSGDIWWLAFLLLGENWHNYHHAFPSDYRNGAQWYQMDVHKWLIYLMSKCGLAWDLKRTEKVRIEAKKAQTMEYYTKVKKDKLESLQDKVTELTRACQEKWSEVENSSVEIRANLKKSFNNAQNALGNITDQLNQQIKSFKNPSDKIVLTITKKVTQIENSVHALYQEIDQSFNEA